MKNHFFFSFIAPLHKNLSVMSPVKLNTNNCDNVACKKYKNKDIIYETDDSHKTFRQNIEWKNQIKQYHED